jgi:hypothetical protein
LIYVPSGEAGLESEKVMSDIPAMFSSRLSQARAVLKRGHFVKAAEQIQSVLNDFERLQSPRTNDSKK